MSKYIETSMEGLGIRYVEEGEEGLVLGFIKGIAEYEKMSDCVVATEEGLRKAIFEQHACNVLIVEYEGKPIGFALYFHTFSTFCGRTNMYLEDIFLYPEMRGKGIGKEVFKAVVKIALEEGCMRMEWVCLNWNEPSIRFYKSRGAFPMSDWTTWRMTTKEMEEAVK
ncbi:MAG: GNAT family N-acetyltransferase [Lachnospiraceae bacterium]